MGLIIQLQHGLLVELQRGGQIYNPASLVTITITGRSDAFTTLAELAQRLVAAMPIVNHLGPYKAEESRRIGHPSQSDSESMVKVLKYLPKLAVKLAIMPAMLIVGHFEDAKEKRGLKSTPRTAQRRRLNSYTDAGKTLSGVELPYRKTRELKALEAPPPRAIGFAVEPGTHLINLTLSPLATKRIPTNIPDQITLAKPYLLTSQIQKQNYWKKDLGQDWSIPQVWDIWAAMCARGNSKSRLLSNSIVHPRAIESK